MHIARCLLAVFLAALPFQATADVAPGFVQPFAKHEMVAAANPLAAEAGLEMLKAGGSAVDAAIASQMVLGLVEPESSGIGGGAFLLVLDPETGKTTSFDGREVAPGSATPGMFLGPDGKARAKQEAIPGGLSVGIPGVVGMLELAHRKYGKLPWPRLFQPAIKLAETGFPVGPKLARTIKDFARGANMPDIKAHFYHADGTSLAEGETYKNPEYARSLREIAAGGAQAFYTGDIAAAIVDKVQHAPVNPGGMTLADLAGFKALEREPVCGAYRVWRLCSMGPPSSGGIAIVQILGMLQRFPSSQLQPGTLSGIHLFTQASKLAYADRAKYLADTGFVQVPIAGLLDKDYIASRAALIDPARDMGTAMAGDPPVKHAAWHQPHDHRGQDRRGHRHDDVGGIGVRRPGDGEGLLPQQHPHRLFALAHPERAAGGQCARARQAAAQRHVPHHRLRPERQVPAIGGIARRPRDH
jgi:gamma-glutamyltranspeptidase/glutathione hydrolase